MGVAGLPTTASVGEAERGRGMNIAKEVEIYRDHLYEPADVVELRCVGGERVRKFWSRAKDLLRLIPELQQCNRLGFNVYIGPNPRVVSGRSGDVNVKLGRCLFADFDGVEPGDGCGVWEFIEPRIENLKIPMPTLTIFSGHGCHVYWRLAKPLSVPDWKNAAARLITALEADPKCKNPERFLRLPGFVNHKYSEPADCFIMATEGLVQCLSK
jgi:hypothetical protein